MGRLIHISDFINEEYGQLMFLDDNGKILRDSQKIIYPGSNGDLWWDTKQLLIRYNLQSGSSRLPILMLRVYSLGHLKVLLGDGGMIAIVQNTS